jgi:predicted nucleotide-binding protein
MIVNEEVIDKSKIFIVHGHDDLAKSQVARFIEKLGFQPIILHEQASSGKTIIEKIEEYSNVGFGIVLYTACDIGAKKDDEENLKSRARQNVIFEHGYLIGKIRRENVVALVKGEIEKPNDISGVVYIAMNDESWKFGLAKELKNSGYDVDMNRAI